MPRKYPRLNDQPTPDPEVHESAEAPSEEVPQTSEDPMPTIDYPPDFEQSLLLVLAHEGGFVNHPRDPGGATNLGISIRYARNRGLLFDLDGDGDVDEADIRLVTPETAAPGYFQDFWQPVRASDLPPGVANAVFDAAVNSGPGRASRWLQAAVGATVDGRIGPLTLAAVAEHDPLLTIERVCSTRLGYMQTLANWQDFRRGWKARVERVIQESHRIHLGLPV